MAIAARGTPTNGHKTNSGTLTISLPTGVVSGDVIVFNVVIGGTTLPSTPTGLTLIDSGNAGPSYATYYRVCDGTEGASFSWTVASSASGTCRAYSGVDNASPINAHSILRTATSLTSTATGITTTANGCQLIYGSGIASSETSFTNPTGFSAQDINTSSPAAVSCDESQTTAGTTGNQSGTWASTANNNYASLVALKPAAGGTANTLTASPGAMTITGDSITPPVAHKPTVSPGAYTITGSASTLPVAHKPSLNPGAMAIAGATSLLPIAHHPTLSPGAMVITGDAATLIVSHVFVLTASPGAMAISGNAVLLPAAFRLGVSPGALTVTGDAATLLEVMGGCPVLTPMSPGTLTLMGLNGNSLSLSAASQGSLTLTPISAGSEILTPTTQGSLTLTPIEPC